MGKAHTSALARPMQRAAAKYLYITGTAVVAPISNDYANTQ